MKQIFILSLVYLSSIIKLQAQTVDVYFGLSDNSSVQCKFADVEGCRIFKVPITLHRNGATGLLDSVVLDQNKFNELFPSEVRGLQPNVNSDNTYMTFLGTKDTLSYIQQHVYVHKLGSTEIFDASNGQTYNNKGTWPIWYDDSTLFFTSSNDCTPSTNAGCDSGSRYSDLSLAKLNGTLTGINNTTTVWGDINNITNLDSKFCSFEDPIVHPNNPNLIAFHSSPQIGGTTYDTIPDDCPFTAGLPTAITDAGAEPQPKVAKMDATASSNLIKDLVPSVDYWNFDLASAGLSGLAHLDWGENDVLIGTEQGSIGTGVYKLCSDTIYGSNQSACLSNGGHMIIYDRPWGFELDNGMYRNIHRSINPMQPLFNVKHPAQLPKSSLFWDPAIDICTSYRAAKQIQFCGSETTIVATVFCKDNTAAIHFSRLYLIDYADINKPFYFDITGWVEDHFPGRWADGQATAYTATCFVTDSATVSVSENEFLNSIEPLLYPNPNKGVFQIKLPQQDNLQVEIYNAMGQMVPAKIHQQTVDLSQAEAGVYVLILNYAGQTYRRKIIKMD